MTAKFFSNVLTRLIDKEFKRREFDKNTLFGPHKKFYPCITVSRETGSGGRLIATLVAKKLKMKFYDKEFVELIAKSARKRKEVIETLDERSRGFVEGLINSLADSNSKLSESRYLRYLYQTILSLTEKNQAVILGRGANFIIPAEKALNVRIIAPLEVRIANTVKYEKKLPLKAREQIWRIHNARKDFIKRYFLKNISNANYYDL
ncbi:hypothetical protein A3J78_00660, partial [Candidatus Beckwithbacteria bacterium RBG_13_35_6]